MRSRRNWAELRRRPPTIALPDLQQYLCLQLPRLLLPLQLPRTAVAEVVGVRMAGVAGARAGVAVLAVHALLLLLTVRLL